MKRTPIKNPEFLYRITETDSVVLMSFDDEDFFWQITGLAADLWCSIDGVKNWEQIKQQFAAQTDLTAEDYHTTADEFLSTLETNQMVRFK